jgi:hypothetical protein
LLYILSPVAKQSINNSKQIYTLTISEEYLHQVENIISSQPTKKNNKFYLLPQKSIKIVKSIQDAQTNVMFRFPAGNYLKFPYQL